MLRFIRKNAQSVVVQAIVLIIAVVFIFWGVGSNIGGNPNALATVNGQEISYRAFQSRYEQTVERYRQQFGGALPDSILQGLGIKQQVLSQLVQAELIRQGAGKIGIAVSKEATQRRIQDMPYFQKDGHFDLATYQEVLERNRLTPTAFEADIIQELLMGRAVESIGKFASVADPELDQWIAYLNQEIKLGYGEIRTADYLDKVQVDEKKLAAWFEEARERYKTEPQCKLNYLVITGDKVAVDEAALRAYYDAHRDEYTTPEQRRARHILFKVDEQATAETRAEKKKAAESVLAQIRQGGDFSELARQFSDDVTRERGGDLGFFGRGQMVPAFEEAVFSLDAGEVGEVVASPFGYHLIKVEEIRPEVVQTFAEAAGSIRTQLEQREAKAQMFKEATTTYEEIIRAGSLAKYSQASGAVVQTTDFFTRSAPPKVPVLQEPALLDSVFQLGKGELSSIIETPTGYAIVFVEDIKPAVVPELVTVRDRAVADYRREQSAVLARSAAEQLLQKARERRQWPEGVQRIESSYLRRVAPESEVPPQVAQDAFSRAGQDVFPTGVVEADGRFYLYQILDVRTGTDAEDAGKREELARQLLALQKERLLNDWVALLQKNAKIWTNAKMLQ
ncbi:MAG: SurA N-terminal domain-containing protein [Desulfobulbus sp.]|jgi:peptidyl-prolyl cis-trans isomerase D